MKKRLLCLLLILSMVFSMLPVTALSAESSTPANAFADVKQGDWFYDAVQYASLNGFFNGTSATQFTPNGTMTRGMFVTVLGRMAGVDADTYKDQSAFDDVAADMYYAPYVAWAVKHKITTGTGTDTFSPNAEITRQQMAAFFVRYFENLGVDYTTDANITTEPADLDKVEDYAKEAVLKLWKQGLLNGDGTNFNPNSNASRAETATLCMRTDRVVPVWYKEPGVPSDRVRQELPAPESGNQTENPGNTGGGTTDGGGIYAPQVTFVTNGGQDLDSRIVAFGTKISELPTPYYKDHIFTGWYYDKELSRLAAENDVVTASVTLYAAYTETETMEPMETPTFASATDVGTDFTVTIVSSKPDLTAA